MARVTLDGDKDHLVTPLHWRRVGPVVRGQSIEVMQMNWRAGESARPHQHVGMSRRSMRGERPHAHDRRRRNL